MISLNIKNLESGLLAEPNVAVMFSCRTLTCSVKVLCRTLQISEPKALNVVGEGSSCRSLDFFSPILGAQKRLSLSLRRSEDSQGFANGGFQTVVRVLCGEQISLPLFNLKLTPFYLSFTSSLPLFDLNLTSASPGISNHGLETTVYRPLG